MILLDASTVTVSQQVIVTLVVSIIGFIGVLVTLLHKDMTGKIIEARKSVEAVHADLKPITIQVALHEESIKELKNHTKELTARLEHHESEIGNLRKQINK